MTRLYLFASRFCGAGAVLCAMLALVAASPSARADDPLTCEQCCTGKGYSGYQHQQCMYDCAQGKGECGAMVSCSGKQANGCTATTKALCVTQGTSCASIHGGICHCGWYESAEKTDPQYCGCFSD